MLNFPLTELIVHRGNVSFLLHVVGGILMTVTAGGQCVEVAVQMAQIPDELLHLSHILYRLMGLRRQMSYTNIQAKQQVKRRLYFTESFKSLLNVGVMTLIPGSPEKYTNLASTYANCVIPRRCRIYHILIIGVRGRPRLTLCVGNSRCQLRSYDDPSNQLQWLVGFNRRVRGRGDAIVLLIGGHSGQIGTKPTTEDASYERRPSRLSLGLSVLFVLLLWTILSHTVICATVVLLIWTLCSN